MINIVLFLVLYIGCASPKQNVSEAILNEEGIVITFKNLPDIDNYFYYTPKIWLKPERLITFYDNSPIVTNELHLQSKKFPQSINLSVKKEYIIMRHQVNALDVNDYLVRKGDSIEIKYFNNLPIVSITNRKTKVYDYMIDNTLNKSKVSEKYSILGKYFGVSYLYLQKIFNDKDLKLKISNLNAQQKMVEKYDIESEIKGQLSVLATDYVKNIINKLDSLNKNSLLSDEQYLFYKQKYNRINDIINVDNGKISVNEIKEKINTSISKFINYPDIYYQQLIEAIEERFIVQNSKFYDLKDGTNKDYRNLYNLVKETTFLKNEDKNYLLLREIDRIAVSFSNKDFLEYFARFEKDVNDTIYINHIKNKYSLKFNDKKSETNSLVLMSSDKKQITFDDLKKRHAGKLIYVDFWASWCAPCRKAMPSSIKLKDKNKDVVFVYLSMDSTIEPWQKAMVDERLSNYSESYLIVNSETSNFLKKQNVSAIPRYMIFDKKGILAFANAPSAESKELEDTFKKLLK